MPDWVRSHLPWIGFPRAASSDRLQMAVLAGEDQVLSYMLAPNGFLNGRKFYCYLFGSHTAVPCVGRKKVPNMFIFIIIITSHFLLKVEVASEESELQGIRLFFPLS